MLVDEEVVEEDQAQQHQQKPYQLTPFYWEWFMVAQQQLGPLSYKLLGAIGNLY
jgi:hypothetical protein